MLKFFRKIRQRLLSENKISKYLIYGAGEIALVMIGILLALQVNNWNEKRKTIKVEKAMLFSFVQELASDRGVFNGMIDQIKAIDSLHQNLYLIGVEQIELKEIGNPVLIRSVLQYGNAMLSIDNYPNLVSEISNKTIRISLSQYYDKLKLYRGLNQEVEEVVADQIRPYLGQEQGYDLEQWFGKKNEIDFPPFVSKDRLIELASQPTFQQLLLQANLKMRQMEVSSKQLIESNLEIQQLTLTELEDY